MSNIYENILSGLQEAIDDSAAEKKTLKRCMVAIVPVKEYSSKEVKKIRNNTGLSQKLFASYMGVSVKTVEAWETGTNRPNGAASRILNMMELDNDLTKKFPFVQVE